MTQVDATRYPGIITYCHRLEQVYDELIAQRDFQYVEEQLAHQHREIDRWTWFLMVIERWAQLERNGVADPSIMELVDALDLGGDSLSKRALIAQASITAVSLLSGTIGPAEPDVEPHTGREFPTVCFRASYGGTLCSWRGPEIQRCGEVFSGFRRGRGTPSVGESDSVITTVHQRLYVGNLNFAFLANTPQLEIRWVDTLAEHLLLNEAERTLSVFRFPSLCAAVIEKSEQSPNLGLR